MDKTSQVHTKAKIYSMWLGEDTDDSSMALEWLTTIASFEQNICDKFSDQEKKEKLPTA